MKLSGRVLIALFVFMFSGVASIASDKEESWEGTVRKLIKDELDASGTPSIQVAIGFKNDIVFNEAYGFADLENRVEATTDTKYRIGSISKWITATTAMALVEQGKLDLDDPIQKYCTSYPEKNWKISSRQLLNHTSGIRHYLDYDELIAGVANEVDIDVLERKRDQDILSSYARYSDINSSLDSFKDDDLLFKPGTKWSYSSHAYRVLGCVLEGASKQDYRKLVHEIVFEKAKMESSIDDDAWAIISNRATGYRLNRDKVIRRADMRDVSENLPAGGHLSTASDLILFAQAFINGRLISKENVSMMSNVFRPNKDGISREPSWRDAIPSENYYGHGTMFFPGNESMWLGHTGRIAGGSSIVLLHPKHDLSIAILTNAKGWNGYMSFPKKIKATLNERKVVSQSN